MKRDARAQVTLEFALVFVSLVIVAVASMRLFSNLGLNLINRYERYRDTRLAAVNSYGSAVDPVAFLDYSPYREITVPITGTPTGTFATLFFEDKRIEEASLLIERANDIMNVIIPYKAQEVHIILGSGNSNAAYILANIDKDDVLDALDRVNDIDALRSEAYYDFYEDMDGVDTNTPNFFGAVGLFQRVLDYPLGDPGDPDTPHPSPFDPDPASNPELYGFQNPPTPEETTRLTQLQTQNMSNRSQVLSVINSLKSTEPQMNTLLNNYLVNGISTAGFYGLTGLRADLNGAIDAWDRWHYAVANICGCMNCSDPLCVQITGCCDTECTYDCCIGCSDCCGLYTDGSALCCSDIPSLQTTYVSYIAAAQTQIGFILNFFTIAHTLPPSALDDMDEKVNTLTGLLAGSPSQSNVLSGIDVCNEMLTLISAEEASTGETYPVLKDKINDIINDLQDALSNWGDPAQRDIYLERARDKTETLSDIVNE